VGVLTGWRYCPRCRSELQNETNHVRCPSCGFIQYAASCPTASAFVLDENDRILLGRRSIEPDLGKWDVPGGFLEEGEDPVAGLRRELREETGLEIEVGEFIGVFTDTYGEMANAPSVLNLVWEARIASGEPTPDDDVAELHWVPRDRLPEDVDFAFRWLAPGLRSWAAGRSKRRVLNARRAGRAGPSVRGGEGEAP
jgi:8-oxo-dGTP diphosphatase